jgi:outer membrane immunogenic protein
MPDLTNLAGTEITSSMKRLAFLLVVVLLVVASQTTFAGPEAISPKESKGVIQPVVEKECCWTGFYIGGFGGYGWGDSLSFNENHEVDPAYIFNQDNFFGGGEAGFNLQVGPRFVLGIEGTFAGGNFDDSASIDANGEISDGRVTSDWIGTIAGRAGVTFWKNRLLAYVKAGAAITQFDYHTEEQSRNGEQFNANEERIAGLIGGGLEYAFTCHWSMKLEYNHLFFGSEDVTGIESNNGFNATRTFRADVGDRDTIQAGINFKF